MSYLEKYASQFEKLFELYQEFNAHTNISAIRDREGIYEKHFQDSLECIELIQKISKDSNKTLELIDIGTGGGFPALPLAIIAQQENLNIKITALDSVAKKLKFIDIVSEALNLQNISTLHARAEEISSVNASHREYFDIAICRSVAYLNILIELAVPLIKTNAYFLAFKELGKTELKDSENASRELKIKLEGQKIYDLEKERKILVFRKIATTHKKYPRKYSQIKAKPI